MGGWGGGGLQTDTNYSNLSRGGGGLQTDTNYSNFSLLLVPFYQD